MFSELKTVAWIKYNKDGYHIVSESKGHYVDPQNESLTLCGRKIPKRDDVTGLLTGSLEGECDKCTRLA